MESIGFITDLVFFRLKKLNKLLTTTFLILLFHVTAQAQLSCTDIFSDVARLPIEVRGDAADDFKVYDISSLIQRVEQLNLKFVLTKKYADSVGRPFRGSYEITVFQEGINVGGIILSKQHHFINFDRLVFESHIGIRPGIRGKGVGTMLYVMAAQVAFRLGGELYSTDVPSQSSFAQSTWRNLVIAGWANKHLDPLWNFTPDKQKHPEMEAPENFSFKKDMLESGFFNPVEELIENKIDNVVLN